MPNDAKLGMVAGVGLVIAAAVIFFHKDLTPPTRSAPTANRETLHTPTEQASPTLSKVSPDASDTPVPPPVARGQYRQTKARTMTRQSQGGPSVAIPMQHVVQDGDTLVNLAQRYYGDTEQSTIIYQANPEVLSSPGTPLAAGSVLIIPALQ